MIQLTSAGKRFGRDPLRKSPFWLITPKERCGIAGANGASESSLVKGLAGFECLDYGAFRFR